MVFFIIDQHAAHERVLFEQALERLRGEAAPSQELLFPLTVELTHDEFTVLLEVTTTLEKARVSPGAVRGHFDPGPRDPGRAQGVEARRPAAGCPGPLHRSSHQHRRAGTGIAFGGLPGRGQGGSKAFDGGDELPGGPALCHRKTPGRTRMGAPFSCVSSSMSCTAGSAGPGADGSVRTSRIHRDGEDCGEPSSCRIPGCRDHLGGFSADLQGHGNRERSPGRKRVRAGSPPSRERGGSPANR